MRSVHRSPRISVEQYWLYFCMAHLAPADSRTPVQKWNRFSPLVHRLHARQRRLRAAHVREPDRFDERDRRVAHLRRRSLSLGGRRRQRPGPLRGGPCRRPALAQVSLSSRPRCNDGRNRDGYSSRRASAGATLDARSAGSSDAASTVAREMAAAIRSVPGSLGTMP
jgi:hypothetical protein